VENKSCEARQELTQSEPAKKNVAIRDEPAKKDSAIRVEPAKNDSDIRVETAKNDSDVRVETAKKLESSLTSSNGKSVDSCQAKGVVSYHPSTARPASRRVPPGGHCSQLW